MEEIRIIHKEVEKELLKYTLEEFRRLCNLKDGGDIMQCHHCFVAWPISGKNGGTSPAEECSEEINRLGLTVATLKLLGIKISHGMCEACYALARQETRRRIQKREGNFECYGRRNPSDLFCDQSGKCSHDYFCYVASRAKTDPHRWWRYPL